MQTLIKTHKMNRTYHGNHFFILSKGNNAGRPMDKPCPNCFVVITKCPHEKQLLYWLCFGLWQCGYFYPHLVGSVIPFLRLPELKAIINKTRESVSNRGIELNKITDGLSELMQFQQRVLRQVELINMAKKSLLHRLIR